MVFSDCFTQSRQSVPKIRRTAVRQTTLGVCLTDVRRDEVKRSGSREKGTGMRVHRRRKPQFAKLQWLGNFFEPLSFGFGKVGGELLVHHGVVVV